MKEKIKKFLIILLIIVSIILTIVNIINNIIHHGIVINILSTISSIIPLFMALYNESDSIYKICNKIRMYFSNKTVKFQTNLKLKLSDEYNLEKINQKINQAFKDSKFELEYGILNIQQCKMYDFNLKNDVTGLITNCRLDVHPELLNIEFTFQISARDIKKTWNIAKKLNDKISNKFECTPIYSIFLDYSSSNLNPFYRLMLKSIDEKESYKFSLEFTENGVKIKINNNKLYAVTKQSMSDLDSILNEYISLSNII